MEANKESMIQDPLLQIMLMAPMLQERLVRKGIIKWESLALPGKPRLCQSTLELKM